jgi:two-component system OmpR family sensor kinase
MIRSLRGRLFLALAALLVVTGAVAGVVMFRWAYSEALEVQDAVLLEVGAIAARNRLHTEPAAVNGVHKEDRIVIEELPVPAEIGLAGPVLPVPLDSAEGLQTFGSGKDQWRVLLVTRADGSRVAVGQRTAYRDEIARGSALRSVVPFAVLVPCLLLLTAAVIGYSLRPVAQLARRLDASDYDHLTELPLAGMPAELLPFIASINRLLGRLASMIEQQRRFVAAAAHELRSPITALSVQAENLDHAELPPESRARLAALQTGIRRTGHLLEQLLALARYETPGTPQAQIAALDRVARGVVAELLPTARNRAIDLGFERIEPVAVRVDATALAVLVRNLVDNALRHTPDGGRIDLHIYAAGGHAVFCVEDTGPGIAEPDLARVFEPFYRGQRSAGEGTGLGLSIVERIAAGASGSVAIENIAAPGKGLRVKVTFAQVMLSERACRQERENAAA